MLRPGDPAPFFSVASSVNPKFFFDTAAGRYIVLSFFGSTRLPASEKLLAEVARHADRFDVNHLVFFGVTIDPADVDRLREEDPGRIYFYDLDLSVSKLYGLVGSNGDGKEAPTREYARRTFILDPGLRVIATMSPTDDAAAHVKDVLAFIDTLPSVEAIRTPAPVIVVPYVFEASLCKELIAYYEEHGGRDSGFMRDVDGRTVEITDYSHKRRNDCEIEDAALVRATQERIHRRITPAIKQAYQFDATRIERHIVACYDSACGAHFRAHRDNTTMGTAHRRFAVTMNLNAEDYEGGEIWFPEFGLRRYKSPTGSATVFSCSLLHEVPPVTRGKRYAFLPFLYDEAAAQVRERNRKFLGKLADQGGPAPAGCNAGGANAAMARVSAGGKPVLEGKCGCGNPSGCGTCLSAPAYQLGTPSSESTARRA